MDRNSRPNFAAFAAEEERRGASEEGARAALDAAEDVEAARRGGEPRPNRTSKIVGWIRRALGR